MTQHATVCEALQEAFSNGDDGNVQQLFFTMAPREREREGDQDSTSSFYPPQHSHFSCMVRFWANNSHDETHSQVRMCEDFSSSLPKAGAEFQGFQCSSVAGLPGTEFEMLSAGEKSICATLGTSAKTNARDLAMRMRVEPAHGPTGSMASGTGRKHTGFCLSARAPCFMYYYGVRT